jgi:hypothetical protein
MRLLIGTMACLLLAGCGGAAPEAPAVEEPKSAAGVTLDLPPIAAPPAPAPAVEETGNTAEAVEEAPEPQPEATPEPKEKDEEPEPEPTKTPEPPAKPETAAATGDAASMRLLPARPADAVAPWAGHIRRAGFQCEGIGSARQLQRPDGKTLEIYKIDCTSGGTYQGTVKQGRLFFREWTGQLERR